MEKQAEQASHTKETSLAEVPGYLSVKEAARIIGVSERSVYGYIEAGKLPGARIGRIIVVLADAVASFQRSAPGRRRTSPPRWHIPPSRNRQYITTIIVRVRPGQSELLERKLVEMRVEHKHRLLSTAARYVGRNRNDPDAVAIILVWRSIVMPPAEEREAAIASFAADLADVLDWETAERQEGQVLLHA